MRWTAPSRSRSTSAPSPPWPISRRGTSSAASAPASARRRTGTCSGGGWSGRCSCCARPTGASRTSASTSASSAWARSVGRSAISSARRRPVTGRRIPRSKRPTASRWPPLGHASQPEWRRVCAVSEKPAPPRLPSLTVVRISTHGRTDMITSLNVASIYVLDKEEALDFYVNKLGLEKGNDVRQGDYRWLTVRVPGEHGTEISLEEPGAPLHDEATATQLRELITKGAMSGLVFKADDIRGLYETLQERGVTDFTQEPTDHFYGTDMGLRDPFGNAIRILQQGRVPEKVTA